jgi:hypothetical protein
MSTTTTSTHRSIAVLKLPINIAALILFARAIVKALTGNPNFPSPTPSLAALTTNIDDLQAAETAAQARTKGAVTTRNEKRAALVLQLQELRAYIQTVANASPDHSASIIESAGLSVRPTAVRKARVFAAKPGAVSGAVKLFTARAAHRASYEWQYSTDGGKTWILAPGTLTSKTTIAGLTPGSTVLFRSRALTTAGEGDWTQPVSLLVS